MKVLIVDDSKVMRLLVRRTLRQAGFENVEVHEAENGRQGVEVYQREQPDVVLADWNMPEMGGMELLQHLRVYDPAVRLGFITSEQTPEIRAAAREAGARFYITKPFTPEEFKIKLHPLLGSPG
ncbi:MAG: response regulator [Deltaproteobacteria bacterium HGW-Deltaproteobacteria-14]|jgi:two-component system chemotaxis response regulator CheY|nr:MAG: response regulator [Deltaproteobacteria bacterium HGW-Deltaproteobacteria-14]